ncbi:MAG: hypothetical protein ABW049_08955 [Spongiibacteraceae bacterium]
MLSQSSEVRCETAGVGAEPMNKYADAGTGPVRICIRTTTGVAIIRQCAIAYGSNARPLDAQTLEQKFFSNASQVLNPSAAQSALTLIKGLDALDTIHPLLTQLRITR